jgi:hypothetical protein|tara:strand:- start:3317 stop:3772 length:456 start_codon:yes stop_codon:yes gene_type:complete
VEISGSDMYKTSDWNANLFDFIDKNKNKPFEWGSWDCCKFTDAAIKVITGESLIPTELSWDSKLSAYKAIKDYGGDLLGSFEKACNAKKLTSLHLNYFTCGDVCVFKGEEEGQLVGFSDGFHILGVNDTGITTEPHSKAIKAWRIESKPNG